MASLSIENTYVNFEYGVFMRDGNTSFTNATNEGKCTALFIDFASAKLFVDQFIASEFTRIVDIDFVIRRL